jgi:hypothetical protein
MKQSPLPKIAERELTKHFCDLDTAVRTSCRPFTSSHLYLVIPLDN